MEMMTGCKQTDVGVIPADWDVGGLGRFWSVTDCKHVTAAFVPDGFPVASIREVQSRFVDLRNAKRTTEHFYDLLIEGGRKPRPGDLILSRNATVGEVAQVTELHPPFAMGQDVCLLRKKSGDHSTEFLQALFESPVILNQLTNLMVGSTFKRANVEQIRGFAVPMPPPLEQRAIAAALSDVDALLAGLDRLIAKKRDLKQAAMQQLLTGQTRLPGFKGEWEVKRLGEHVAFLKNGVHSRAALTTNGPIKNLHYGDIHASRSVILDPSSMPSLSSDCARALGRLMNGDLVFVDASEDLDGVGKSVEIVGAAGVQFVAGLHTIAARFDPSVLAHGFKAYLQFCPPFRLHLKRLAAGTKVYATNRGHIASAEMPLPSVQEQSSIAAVLSDMDAELTALEARRDKTRALKQGMMQELLTGRTRLV